MLVHYQDPRYLSGELVCVSAGFVRCRKKGETKFYWLPMELYNRNEYETPASNKVTVKDKFGKFYLVSKDDPRYLNGELVHNWVGLHHSEETKQKMHETHLMNQHQQGEKKIHNMEHVGFIMKINL